MIRKTTIFLLFLLVSGLSARSYSKILETEVFGSYFESENTSELKKELLEKNKSDNSCKFKEVEVFSILNGDTFLEMARKDIVYGLALKGYFLLEGPTDSYPFEKWASANKNQNETSSILVRYKKSDLKIFIAIILIICDSNSLESK